MLDHVGSDRPYRAAEHEGGWTEERVETLKKMWAEGASASEIALMLGGGVTRSGVIGKVHRMKLTGRNSRIRARPSNLPAKRKNTGNPGLPRVSTIIKKRNARQKAEDSRVRNRIFNPSPMMAAIPLPEEPDEGVDVTARIGLLDLTERTCKWPVGDPLLPGFGFCGAPKPFDVSQPYCERHRRRSTNGA